MGKPVARRESRRRTAASSNGEQEMDFSPKPSQRELTKKQRIAAAKRSRSDRGVSKKLVRIADDGGPESHRSAASESPVSAAPAKAARNLAATSRLSVKAAAIKAASRHRHTSMTTTNLKDKERRRIFTAELQQIKTVANHSAFVADPFGAMEAHLAATAELLQPQTPDVGRKLAVKPNPHRGLAERQRNHANQRHAALQAR